VFAKSLSDPRGRDDDDDDVTESRDQDRLTSAQNLPEIDQVTPYLDTSLLLMTCLRSGFHNVSHRRKELRPFVFRSVSEYLDFQKPSTALTSGDKRTAPILKFTR
jgi:hypothetical protein